jgi:hypothetical protein
MAFVGIVGVAGLAEKARRGRIDLRVLAGVGSGDALEHGVDAVLGRGVGPRHE